MSDMRESVVCAVMAAPLPVGLVGAGPWARIVTGPVLAAGPQTRVTGVWSRTGAHAKELAAQLGVEAYDDVDALFSTCEAAAIVVAPSAQPDLAIRAARAGKTLLLEKPLALDVDGARAIVETGAPGLVMLTHRFNPDLDEFLGVVPGLEPLGGRGCFISGAFLEGPFATGWRLERGAVLDVGPHLLDLLEATFGEIVDVRAAGNPLGWTSLVCTHASGITSDGSLCCRAATDSRTEVEVFGRAGTARYDARRVDRDARANRVRDALVDVAAGGSHPASVQQALHLQELIATIEDQLQ
jgi:predicted dehydrogenase